MNLQLPQQTYQSRSKPFSSERLLNMLFEPSPANRNLYMLVGAPGLKEYYDLGGDEQIRGMMYLRDCLVFVTTSKICIVYQNPTTKELVLVKQVYWSTAGWGNPVAPVQMCSNGDCIMMHNPTDNSLYIVEILELDVTNPDNWNIAKAITITPDAKYKSVAYISGVFVGVCQKGQDSFIQYSEVLGRSLEYEFQLDTALTNLTAVSSNMRELWCFGANSIEVVSPTGETGNDFFAHVTGAYVNMGCVCKNSIAVHETVFFFYATNGVIYAAENYTSLKQISTPALLEMIKSWGELDTQLDKDSVLGQIYTHAGHTFYMLKFKKFGKTLLYDIITSSWSERETGNGGEWEGEYVVRRPNGEMIVSSATTDKLYVMDMDVHTDNGLPIRREFVFGTIKNEAKHRMFFYSLTLDVDVGLGPDDTVMLSWSDDGGYTWTGERMLKLGNYGQYKKKLQFRRLGSSALRTYKVRFSTASRINVLSADMEAEEGTV